MNHRATEDAIRALIGTDLTALVEEAVNGQFLIHIPESMAVDKSLEELASLVARTSNVYGRAARFAGLARVEAKLAKGGYDRKYRQARNTGRNDAERDAAAMSHCAEEHSVMTIAEAVAELADAMEAAARVASESARKLHTSAENQTIAERRGAHGHLRDTDFRPY